MRVRRILAAPFNNGVTIGAVNNPGSHLLRYLEGTIANQSDFKTGTSVPLTAFQSHFQPAIKQEPPMKRSWPVFVAFLSFSVLGSSGSAQAGLFDFLFGNQQPAAPYGYAPQRPMDMQNRKGANKFRDPREAKEKSHRDAERLSASGDKASPLPARDLVAIRKLSAVARDQGFQAAFMQDPTLRPGDILVTQAGIVVFEGGDKSRANNFRPLSSSRLKNRADLALLQKISGFGQPHLALPASDAMPPLVIQQRGRRAAKADTPGNQPPKVDLPKVEPSRIEPRKAETAKVEPVKIDIANPREAAITQ
ncbi:hypothetical protein PY365_19750 [Roseiarcaceae bacterium H3SJ34-1]|uniref:hypothetical protein n=1 Tax=Terripilifer ovatus TaxID=3032367 RepID=UPI003AB97AC3|nr:hypothetical protein [Roseiarcaceae bacterium H3SJ34-1]